MHFPQWKTMIVLCRYSIGRDVDEGVFILNFGLMICVSASDCIVNSDLLSNVKIPIPLCRDFVFPGKCAYLSIPEFKHN